MGSDPGQRADELPVLCSFTEMEMAQDKGAGELIALSTETGSDPEYLSQCVGGWLRDLLRINMLLPLS